MERRERRGRLRGRHLVLDAGRDTPETRSILEASHADRTVAGEIFLLHRTLSVPRAKDPLSARGVRGSLSTSRNLSAVADGRRGTDSLPRLRARDPYCRNGKITGDAHRPCLCHQESVASRSVKARYSRFLSVIQGFWRLWSLRSKIPRSRSFSRISDATSTGFIGGANRGNRDTPQVSRAGVDMRFFAQSFESFGHADRPAPNLVRRYKPTKLNHRFPSTHLFRTRRRVATTREPPTRYRRDAA